jgi:hypothetical protein
MKRLEKYIPIAIDVVNELILHDCNEVKPEWDNCASNFGAAMRQMGMLAAVTAFSQDSDRTQVSRKKLMHFILRIILLAENEVCEKDQALLPLVKMQPSNKYLQRQVINATIAMKLALRLFIEKPIETEETSNEPDSQY